eukprot:gene7299-415_t
MPEVSPDAEVAAAPVANGAEDQPSQLAKTRGQGRLKNLQHRGSRNQTRRSPMGYSASMGQNASYYWPSVLASCLSPWTARSVSSCFCDKCQRVFVNDFNVLQHFKESWYHTETSEHYEASHVLYLYECQEMQMSGYTAGYGDAAVYGTDGYNGYAAGAKSSRPGGKGRKGGASTAGPNGALAVAGSADATNGDAVNGVAAPHSDLYTPSDSSDGCADEAAAVGLDAGVAASRVKKDITGLLPASDSERKRAGPAAGAGAVAAAPSGVEGVPPPAGTRKARKQQNPQAHQQRQGQGLAAVAAPKPREDYNSAFPPLAVGEEGGPVSPPVTPPARWTQPVSSRKLRVEAPTWQPKNTPEGSSGPRPSAPSSTADPTPEPVAVDTQATAAKAVEVVAPSTPTKEPAPLAAAPAEAPAKEAAAPAPVEAAAPAPEPAAAGKPLAFAAMVQKPPTDKPKAKPAPTSTAPTSTAGDAAPEAPTTTEVPSTSTPPSVVSPDATAAPTPTAAPPATATPVAKPTSEHPATTGSMWASRSFAAMAAAPPPPKPPAPSSEGGAASVKANSATSRTESQDNGAPKRAVQQGAESKGARRNGAKPTEGSGSNGAKPIEGSGNNGAKPTDGSGSNSQRPGSDSRRRARPDNARREKGEGEAPKQSRNRQRGGDGKPAPKGHSEGIRAAVEVAKPAQPAPTTNPDGSTKWSRILMSAPQKQPVAVQPVAAQPVAAQ